MDRNSKQIFTEKSENLFKALLPLVKQEKKFLLDLGGFEVSLLAWWDRKLRVMSLTLRMINSNQSITGLVLTGNEKTCYIAQVFGNNVESLFDFFPLHAILDLIQGLKKRMLHE